MNSLVISFGGLQRERLQIEVLSHERPLTGEYHDDNWLSVSISVSAGGFQGKTDAAFLTIDFISFLSQARTLYETLGGKAELLPWKNNYG